MRDLLAFLGLMSSFIAVMGIFMLFNNYTFLTFFLGGGFGIVFFALMKVLDHLEKIDKKLENNNRLLTNLRSQIDKDVNTFEENWECSHCGLTNPYTESTCKNCGFH